MVGADESTLVREERTWLEGRLVIGLEKTCFRSRVKFNYSLFKRLGNLKINGFSNVRNILDVFENDSLADDDDFEAER